MYKIFEKFISLNFKVFIIRFNENKKYIQGMFYTNNSKMKKPTTSIVESQGSKSIKTILTDDIEVLNLQKTDDESLLKEVQLTSK
jgi:hypothetical protein